MKKFLIIGNQNAITYKEVFPLIKNNKMWLGISTNGSNRWFRVPNNYIHRNNSSGYKEQDGKKYLFVNGIMWFTNMDHSKRHEKIDLYKHYTPEEYPKYDNYDAINVDKYKDIPYDYDGVMGVPITFIDHYNPRQLKILGRDRDFTSDKKSGIINGKQLYVRVFIKNLHK